MDHVATQRGLMSKMRLKLSILPESRVMTDFIVHIAAFPHLHEESPAVELVFGTAPVKEKLVTRLPCRIELPVFHSSFGCKNNQLGSLQLRAASGDVVLRANVFCNGVRRVVGNLSNGGKKGFHSDAEGVCYKACMGQRVSTGGSPNNHGRDFQTKKCCSESPASEQDWKIVSCICVAYLTLPIFR